jgi:hypothetical protein
MSATFERDKYKAYFAAVPDAGVNVVLIPSGRGFGTPGRTTSGYLEQAVRLLSEVDPDGDEAGRLRCLAQHPAAADATTANIGPDLLKLTADLAVAQCRELSAIEAADGLAPNSLAVLVFCPTYRTIELVSSAVEDSQTAFARRWAQRQEGRVARLKRRLTAAIAALDRFSQADVGNEATAAAEREYSACCRELAAAEAAASEGLKLAVKVLHSSLDVETLSSEALGAGAALKGGRRVFLATSIAESSVTIAGLAVVIDLARANRVFWDASRKTSFARLEWASQVRLMCSI